MSELGDQPPMTAKPGDGWLGPEADIHEYAPRLKYGDSAFH
ncbi:hypothetical protein [Bradyrhizobium sp. CCBAU 11386]|nr:hypothetical protein [Bradyrhizobium sp. CCBAU 11386]